MSEKDQNKLAIVIPYYKIDFFEETIQSVAKQANKNFNLYIGNDASPNDPLPIIQKYFSSDDYNYFNYKTNLGSKNLALQWERILENVHEEWFQILGDDDLISENFVEEFYNNLYLVNSKKINVLKFLFHWINEDSIPYKIHDYNTQYIGAEQILIKKYFAQIDSSLSENVFRTSMYKKNKFEKIPLAWGSDELAILSFSGLKPVLFLKNAAVSVRIYSNSISGSEAKGLEKSNAYNIYREKLIMKYGSRFPADFVRRVINDYLNWCYYKKQKANIGIIFYELKKFQLVNALKIGRRIFYIERKLKIESQN
ncbi:glycosyltransferase family A protein [Chryseobacterium sp. SN22]|uniref:glycosyltransferase family A protein n=1 Tax=Chryseobacterium sp. SN22 TaxID=2606431 RepID=UPI00162A670F|nr:glycosyltransferase family 2 protein [Chryseobacterium sp. SN22]